MVEEVMEDEEDEDVERVTSYTRTTMKHERGGLNWCDDVTQS
jgi:hypothetical protein